MTRLEMHINAGVDCKRRQLVILFCAAVISPIKFQRSLTGKRAIWFFNFYFWEDCNLTTWARFNLVLICFITAKGKRLCCLQTCSTGAHPELQFTAQVQETRWQVSTWGMRDTEWRSEITLMSIGAADDNPAVSLLWSIALYITGGPC